MSARHASASVLDGSEPPHDLEAEMAVLGSMLLSTTAVAGVGAYISAADHYRPAHQAIHAAIVRLADRGDPHDAIAVRDELERQGELRGGLDAPYLHTLIEAVPAAANAGYYARIVRERSRRRKMIEIATRSFQRAHGPDTDLDAALAEIEAELADLALTGISSRLPQPVRLDELLAEPDEEVVYRVGRLWPAGGRVVIAAQRKAGKTTIMGNLLRCLADGDAFLDRYEAVPVTGTVFHFDTEMPRSMLKRWLRDQGIRRADLIHVELLRGRVTSFDILQPAVRAEWAALIRSAGTEVVSFDCIGPVLAALGLSENDSSEVGTFLVAFEQLLEQAGVAEAALFHHMGHAAERSRGASRLRDWPDAEWKLVYERPREGDGEPGPSAARYFEAAGRDVAEAEQRLDFDPATRHLSAGGGSRQDERAASMLAAITAYIEAQAESDCSQSRIEAAVEGRAQDVRQVLDRAVQDRVVCRHVRGQAKLHRIFAKCPDHSPDTFTGQTLFGAIAPSAPSSPVPDSRTDFGPTPSRDNNARSEPMEEIITAGQPSEVSPDQQPGRGGTGGAPIPRPVPIRGRGIGTPTTPPGEPAGGTGLCEACSEPMTVIEPGQRWHPNCDPGEQS